MNPEKQGLNRVSKAITFKRQLLWVWPNLLASFSLQTQNFRILMPLVDLRLSRPRLQLNWFSDKWCHVELLAQHAIVLQTYCTPWVCLLQWKANRRQQQFPHGTAHPKISSTSLPLFWYQLTSEIKATTAHSTYHAVYEKVGYIGQGWLFDLHLHILG